MPRDAWLIILIVALTLGCERAPVADVPDPVAPIRPPSGSSRWHAASSIPGPWRSCRWRHADHRAPGAPSHPARGRAGPDAAGGRAGSLCERAGALDIVLDPDFASIADLSVVCRRGRGRRRHAGRARPPRRPGARGRRGHLRGHHGRRRPHFGSRLGFDPTATCSSRWASAARTSARRRWAISPARSSACTRRQRAGGQPLRRPGRCARRRSTPPATATRRGSPCIPTPAGSGRRARAARRRRGQPRGRSRDYGWPVITHGRATAACRWAKAAKKEGMAQPLHCWVPSISPRHGVLSGRCVPEWQGDLFVGGLSGQLLARLDSRRAGGRGGAAAGGRARRIRDVRSAPTAISTC